MITDCPTGIELSAIIFDYFNRIVSSTTHNSYKTQTIQAIKRIKEHVQWIILDWQVTHHEKWLLRKRGKKAIRSTFIDQCLISCEYKFTEFPIVSLQLKWSSAAISGQLPLNFIDCTVIKMKHWAIWKINNIDILLRLAYGNNFIEMVICLCLGADGGKQFYGGENYYEL